MGPPVEVRARFGLLAHERIEVEDVAQATLAFENGAVGMIEASGIGWQGRYEQGEMVAAYLTARREAPAVAAAFDERVAGPPPDLSGGYHYLGLERMAYYVNKDAYRRAVRSEISTLQERP